MNSAILETNKKKIVPQNYESGYQDESQLIPDTEIPPVLNINDYMGAKDAYEEEEHPLIKGSIADKMRGYWELEKFENYRDVDQEAEQKKRGDIERFFDNFYKNLEDPEVSAEIIKAYGKDFFESFKSASDEDKEKILGSRYLRAVYGDTDEALMMHRRALGVPIMKNDITDTTEGAWKQRTAQRGPIVKSAYEETKKYKEYLASSSKIQDKLDEYIYARIETGSTEEAMRKAGFDDKDREALSNVLWDNRMDLSIERAGRFVKAQELGPVDEGSVLERAKELFSNGRTVRFDESGKPLVLYQQHAGLTWEESLKKAADELRPKFTQKDITRFGQDLAKLKQSDPRAYEYVVGIYHKEANSIRNNGTAFFTPFYYMMGSMLESTLDFAKEGGKMSLLLGMRPVMAGDPLLDVGGGMESMYNEAQKNVKLITQEENDAISQIRELKKSISQSPDESPWYRYVADTLGTMAAQTLDFATTGGLVTFTSLTHDRTEQLIGEGNSGTESITRGLFAGGTEFVIERLGGQYFAKNMKWLGRKVPGAQRFVGYVGGASEAVKRGMYKSAGARFGVASLGAGLSEWAEEFAQPTLQTPLDSLTAWAFGSDNGMTWDDWADEMSGAADWKLGLSMAVFGGAFGAASLPGYSREAAIAKLNPNEIMAMWGVSESEAKRISRIANPVQKFKALEELPSYEMASKAKQLDNVRLGFKNMEDDHAWLVESEVYQAEVEAMSLPQVTKKGDDQWEFTSKVKTEDGFEEIKSTYSTKEATAVMQDLVTSQFAERMVEAKEMINKGRLINALEGSGKFVFEEMSEQETIESIRSLAKQAALLIDQGENAQNEASALGSKMTLAQIMDLEQSFSERAEQESGRDAGFNVEQAASSAYRIPMKNGQTLIRYYNKQASTLELMEEVIETHLTEDMRSKGFDLEYYHNQIAAVDEYLHKEGYMRDGDHLIDQSGRTSQKVDVIEGISKLAKGDVLSRMDKMNLPEWLKDFLSWVRNVVGSAVALAKLGDGLAQLEALSKKGKSKVDIDFIEAVHALSNNLQGYFVQEGEMAVQGSIEMMAQSVKEGQEDAFVVAGESFSMTNNRTTRLAPNGKQSNLTDEQYDMVRTEAFKNWFGDWENDPANSSKVVDENGEPLVMYHGTSYGGFSVFDTYSSRYGLMGQGAYFTDNDSVAESYSFKGNGGSKKIYEVCLSIKNPLDMDAPAIADKWKEAFPGVEDFLEGGDSNESWFRAAEEQLRYDEMPSSDGAEIIRDGIINMGYDGITHIGGGRVDKEGVRHRVYIAYESEQIKSATDNRGTFDGENPDITFSLVSLSDKSGNKLSRDTFITTPNGDIDWFAIPKRKGQEAMPVRLLVGEEKGNHKGYGLSHIIGSRDDDVVRLWDKVSPEKYLSGIVNNISEIYEVAPGRELLVKGKQPSSWLFVQMIQSDGYYSIITAYPMRMHQKPRGKKIPFGERSVAPRQLPPNSKSGTERLPVGYASESAPHPNIAVRDYEGNVNPSISVVNINDIVAKFDDGRSMDASYSMSMKVMEGMSSTTQRLELVSRMMRSLKAEVLTWDKFEGSTKQEEFLKAVGKNLSLVKTAAMGLPMEYRAKVKPFIDKIEVLTEVAVKGRVEDTKDMMNRIALKETKEDFAQIKEDTEEWADRLSQEMAKWAKHDHKVNQKGLRAEQKELRAEALRLTKQWESLVMMEKTGEVQNTKAGKELASEMEGEWHDGKTEDEAEFPYMEDVTREVKAWAKKKKAEVQKELKDLYQSSQEAFKGFAFNKKMMLSQEVEKGMKAYAEEKVHEVMRDAFTEIAGKYEAFTKGVIDEKMQKMLKSALNLKKNGKRDKEKKRGKISYEAYAYLEDRVIPLLRMTAEEKKAEEDRLNARILELSANENNTAEQQVEMNEVSTDLLELGVYGCFEQMSADEAFKAYQSLHEYITTQKESWKEKAEAYTQRMRAISRQLVGDLNITGKVADENALREANEAFKNGKIQWAKIADYMESMHQFLDRLGSHKSKALQALSARLRNQLGEAEEAMTMSSMRKSAEVEALYEMILTKDVLSMRHVSSIKGWVEWFKQSHDTGISKKGIKAFSLEMGIKEIEELRGMSKSQLDQWISKRWDAGEKYYSHAGVAALIENLNEYEVNLKSDQERKQRGEKQEKLPNGKYFRPRKRLSAQGVDQGGNIESLKLSRDNALYIILQSEQDSYREMLRDQGWTPDVIKQLREFVGEEGVQIGYGLRDMFARQGNKLAEKYQDKYGMRFPRVENYYPARFSVYDVQDDSALSDMIAGIPTVGGGQNLGWQKQRTDHNRKIDTSVGALGVFFEATTLSDSWYYMDDFVSEVKALLKNRDVAESLVSNLGVNDYVRLRQWVELVERQGVVKGKSVGALDNLVNGIMSGSAKSILAFRVETLLKQGSAVLNAWIGDDTIGLTDYLLTMAKMRNNTSQMSIAKMLKSDVFQSRISSKLDIEALSKMGNDTTQSMAENMIMVGMGLIEGTDVLSNVFGATALWNIKYNQAIKAGLKSYVAEEEAWSAVRASLKKAAQPIGWSEKSFGGLKVNAFGRMMFFMMSENVNKSAIVWNLIQDALTGGSRGLSSKQRWKKLGKAGQIWLAWGAVQSLIGALLDYFTDDEERRKDRDVSGYVYSALFGVINGFPLLGEGIEAMFGGNVYAGSSGRALINLQGGRREVMKLAKMIGDDNEYSAYEYTMQSIKLLRFFGAVGGAVSKGSSKVAQVIGQYMQAGVSVTNPITTINKVANSHLVEE